MEAPRPLSRPRRHRGARQLARGLCLGALIAALFGPATASAGAVAGPGVLVVGPDGKSGFVTGEEIRAGTPEARTSYLVRATPDEAAETTTRAGMPVGELIEAAGIPFEGSGYLTVPRPNGTTAYIAGEDFLEPSPAFEEGKPALVSVDGDSTRFFRPLIPSTPDDVNVVDSLATVSGEALTIGVHRGNLLEVQVEPATASVPAGSEVELRASATGGAAGESFEFSWSFGDGSATGSGGSVVHAFAGSGTYEVRVTATGSDGSGGESGPVAIVVGDPPTTASPGATSEPAAVSPPTGPNGPSGKGTTGRGGKGTKPGGSGGTGARTASPGGREDLPAPHRDRSARSPRPTAERRTGSPRPPRDPKRTVAPATSGAASTGGGEGTVAAGGSRPSGPRPPAPRSPTRPAPERESPAAGGELVEGRLVGDRIEATAVEEEVAGSAPGSGARSAAGQVTAPAGVGVPLVAVAVACMFAAGALFEWRRTRPIR